MDGSTMTIRLSSIQSVTASLTCRSWSIPGVALCIMPELLSIPAGSSSTTKVRWRQPMRLSTRRAASGGCMANSRCGNQTGRPSLVWHNIQKTPAARAVATVMLRLEALIPTVSTCVASPDSMHSSVRTMNSRWN